LFLAAGGLRQPLPALLERGLGVALGPRIQRGGIARGVPTQVGHRLAQPRRQGVEESAERGLVGLLAQDLKEARQVPVVGDVRRGGDADQPAQRGVAVQLGQASMKGRVPQGDGQQHDAPQHGDGIIIAALAAGGAEAVEQGLVGNGVEEVAEGLQGGAILQLAPGEQRRGGVNLHGGISLGGVPAGIQRNRYPVQEGSGGKIRKKAGRLSSRVEKQGGAWGKDLRSVIATPFPTMACPQRMRLGRSATRLSVPVAHGTVTPSHPRCWFTPDRTGGNLLLDRPDGHLPCSTRFLYRSSSVATASSANWAAAGWGRSIWRRTPNWAARSPSKCPTSPRTTPLPSSASNA